MTVKTPVYFDYAATIPVDRHVAEKMIPYLIKTFGNPAPNSHAFGWEAEETVEKARADIVVLINTDSKEIILTSGATESNNLAIKGAANFYKIKDKHLITVKVGHKAVFDTMRELERQGFEVTYLGMKENGLIDLKELKVAICDDIILISVMWVNNETGVVQDISAIGEIYHKRKIIFHVDAAQACSKAPIDVEAAKIDPLSMSGHRIYDPKGIGALYVRREPRVRLEVQIRDGGHGRGLRNDTSSTHQIVGMGEASHIAKEELKQDMAYCRKLHDIFLKDIGGIKGVYTNGDLEHRAPNNLNASFSFVGGESLIIVVKELAVSSSSTCISASPEPSYVLCALGRNDGLAHPSLRITSGRMTTEGEVQFAVGLIKSKTGKLRKLLPLWEMFRDGIDSNSIEWITH